MKQYLTYTLCMLAYDTQQSITSVRSFVNLSNFVNGGSGRAPKTSSPLPPRSCQKVVTSFTMMDRTLDKQHSQSFIASYRYA